MSLRRGNEQPHSWIAAGVRLLVLLAAGPWLGVAHAQLPTAPPTLPAGQTVTVNGAKLWYISEGRGEPLLIISGGPGAAHYLYPYFSALQATHRVIYLDSFGTGKSDRAKTRAEYTLARHVDEIEGFREALGLGPINVLGHSYGSLVAQAYALKYPGAARRVILAAPFISGEAWQGGNDFVNESIRQHFPEIAARIEALRARGLKESDKELADAVGSVPEELLYYANVTNAGRLNVDFNLEVAFALGGDNTDFQVGGEIAALDFRPKLRALRAPLLVLAGRYDRVATPRFTQQFRAHVPQAEFVMFEKSGHNFFLEENAKMVETLRVFLARPGLR